MKNITLKLVLLSAIVLSVSSCTTYRQIHNKYNTSPVYDLEQGAVTNGTLETILQMTGEVTATHEFTNNTSSILSEGVYVVDDEFLLRFKSDNASLLYLNAKATVLHKALEKAGCDMILAPIYRLEVKGEEYTNNGVTYYPSPTQTTYVITIKGFGANITGVRQIQTRE